MDHESCINCGKKCAAKNSGQGMLKSIASFLCATCLLAQVGVAELDFGKAAKQDRAVNDFSHKGIDLIFSTNTSTGLTLSASPGDLMIDFAHIYQIQHPTPPIRFYSYGESI